MSGTKVTNDSESGTRPTREGGIVDPDSLAAESIQAGGAYSDNPTTGGTADAGTGSTGTVLEPAANARARLEQTGADAELGTGRGATDTIAPAYKEDTNVSQPKGKDLHEGGFDSGAPNASYSTAIGTKKDPGRAALEKMEDTNAAVSGGGPRESQLATENPYDQLGGETTS